MKRPRDRGGSQDGMGPRTVCPLEDPLRVVWERERGDSLPSCVIRQNTDDRAASVGRRAVPLGGGVISFWAAPKKIEGSFFCGVLVVCRARCQYGPPSRAAVSNHRLKRTWIMHARTHECVARHIHPLRIDYIPMNIPRNCTRSPTYLGGPNGLRRCGTFNGTYLCFNGV